MMSINAVKGVEIGNGFGAGCLTGEENADEIRAGNDGKPEFLSNNAGGVLGGISTGQDVVCRFAVKPTSSILTPPAQDGEAMTRNCATAANGNEVDRDQGPPRPLRGHPRRAGGRGHDGHACWPTTTCAIAARIVDWLWRRHNTL
jgi:hypothetical protein